MEGPKFDAAAVAALGPEAVEAALAALLAAYAPRKDSADAVLASLKAERARQEAEAQRLSIIKRLEAVIDGIEPAILDAVPPGRTVRLQHVPSSVDPNGRVIPAYVAFDVEFEGGLSTVSSTRIGRGRAGRPESGFRVQATLDGRNIEGGTYKAVYVEVAKALGVTPPKSSYSAHRELDALANRFKGRLAYTVTQAPAPAAPATDAAPADTAAPAAP